MLILAFASQSSKGPLLSVSKVEYFPMPRCDAAVATPLWSTEILPAVDNCKTKRLTKLRLDYTFSEIWYCRSPIGNSVNGGRTVEISGFKSSQIRNTAQIESILSSE